MGQTDGRTDRQTDRHCACAMHTATCYTDDRTTEVSSLLCNLSAHNPRSNII